MKDQISRRSFVKTGAAAALAAVVAPKVSAAGTSPAFLWGALLHMGHVRLPRDAAQETEAFRTVRRHRETRRARLCGRFRERQSGLARRRGVGPVV